MTNKYRPSNGTEGVDFFNRFCDHCQKDRAHREDPEGADGCDILARSFALDVDHKDYPTEWTFKDGSPTCTAYQVETDEPLPPPRCERTLDLFNGHKLS